MQLIENIRLAFTSIAANKMRSVLTMIGIIIGISAVIMITTIGNSIQKTLVNTFNSIGSLNYFDVYLYIQSSEDTSDVLKDDDKITREMLDELVKTYPDYFYLNLTSNYNTCTLRNWNNQDVKVSLNSAMSTQEYTDLKILRGRGISYQDSLLHKQTAWVSSLFVEQYFPKNIDPIGQTLTFELPDGQSQNFVIVGVYELPAAYMTNYEPGTKDIDKVTPVYVPYDTMTNLLHEEEKSYYYAEVYYYTENDIEMLTNVLQEFFEEKYHEKPYVGFEIYNMQKQLGMINTVVNVVTVAISVIAAISLIVGGVGVMNIMLVSITERTKEIGVRKALGAQNSSIRMQFVVEAILICLIGGLIGITLGILGGVSIGTLAKALVNQMYPEYASIFSITIQPSIPAILISVGFSILTGVFFGYYPANKAAKMNPIDALRYD